MRGSAVLNLRAVIRPAIVSLWSPGQWFDDVTPHEVTVKAGSIVRRGNRAPSPHFMKPVDGSDPGGPVSASEVFEHRFDAPGTYVWYCADHTYAAGVLEESPTTVIVTP